MTAKLLWSYKKYGTNDLGPRQHITCENEWLIDWYLTPTLAVFKQYRVWKNFIN